MSEMTMSELEAVGYEFVITAVSYAVYYMEPQTVAVKNKELIGQSFAEALDMAVFTGLSPTGRLSGKNFKYVHYDEMKQMFPRRETILETRAEPTHHNREFRRKPGFRPAMTRLQMEGICHRTAIVDLATRRLTA